ncbi:MAG TPA: hypothetical protein VK447_17750, partial [Myxococcaceae bacterium]|nr:hypothetical protein [Myxococcaceae bacterium]
PLPEVTAPARNPERVVAAPVTPAPVMPPKAAVAPVAAPVSAPVMDPVFTALATTQGGTAVVVEANALRNTPAGQLAVECFLKAREQDGDENPIEKLRDEARVDVTRDLDRVAIMDEGVVLTGHFAQARWDRLMTRDEVPRTYGTKATVYERPDRIGPDGRRYPSRSSEAIASWGDNLLYVGDKGMDRTKQVIDTLEGRVQVPAPVLTPDQAYGEIYGVISGKHVAELLPFGAKALADRLPELMHHVELHVDAARDVRVSAELKGVAPENVEELAASIEAGLELVREKAKKRNPLMAKFLEGVRLVRSGSQLRVEAEVPLATLEKELAWCRDQRTANR